MDKPGPNAVLVYFFKNKFCEVGAASPYSMPGVKKQRWAVSPPPTSSFLNFPTATVLEPYMNIYPRAKFSNKGTAEANLIEKVFIEQVGTGFAVQGFWQTNQCRDKNKRFCLRISQSRSIHYTKSLYANYGKSNHYKKLKFIDLGDERQIGVVSIFLYLGRRKDPRSFCSP